MAAVRTRRIAFVVSLLVAVGATVVACSRMDLSTLAAAAPIWVLAALGLNCASMVLRSFAWLGTLRGALPGSAVPVGGVVRATMIGVLASAVTPARLGEGVRTWLVSRRIAHRNAVATVVGTVLSQTVLNIAALLLLAAIAVPGALFGQAPKAMLIVFAAPAVLAAGLLLWTRLTRDERVRRHLTAIRSGLAVFRKARLGASVSALQLAAWGVQMLAAYVLLLALHLHVASPLATAAAILFAVNVTAAVPITPSNLGVFQAACVAVLAAAGVAAGDGLAYGLLLQAVEMVSAVLLGVPAVAIELTTARSGLRGARPA